MVAEVDLGFLNRYTMRRGVVARVDYDFVSGADRVQLSKGSLYVAFLVYHYEEAGELIYRCLGKLHVREVIGLNIMMLDEDADHGNGD